jgi:hypothetical protein
MRRLKGQAGDHSIDEVPDCDFLEDNLGVSAALEKDFVGRMPCLSGMSDTSGRKS